RQNKISAAINKLNNQPAGHKHPSVNSVMKNFRIPETTLRRAAKNGIPPKR
ncbi:18002_t:CDS:1, partial [Racocetra fulgida]